MKQPHDFPEQSRRSQTDLARRQHGKSCERGAIPSAWNPRDHHDLRTVADGEFLARFVDHHPDVTLSNPAMALVSVAGSIEFEGLDPPCA
ncbi:MAG: hypothetical protein ABS35_44785 [Kaistia sp. SCN 65-12]|nr:MAG: hypothetical protein ABS35_44785 [Kaistia sp. SCN 65-12]